MTSPIRHHLLASAFVMVAAATGFSAGPALAQKQGGTLTVGLELDIPGFDGLKVGLYDTAANIAASLLLETLVKLDDNGKPKPSLALSWSSSDDFRVWTFKLRSDVKFHDGTPFNAQAVAWTFARLKDPKNNCRCAFYIANILNVEAKDDLTAVYTLKDPAVNFPAVLARPTETNTVHSPTAIQAKGDDYNRNPVGTGPFILKSWTAGDRMVVERNPNYWDKGKPHLDRVVLRPLPDSQSRFASLKAGETDLVWADEFEADNILRARKDATLQVLSYAGSGAAVNAINTKVPPLDDVRVRRALVMAIDRKKMSQALTSGIARPASNPYGEGSWVKCKDDGALPEDPKKAAELIKEYGKPVQFKMLFTATPRGRANGQVLQQFWKQIGVDMEIEQVDQATFPPRAFQRKFDIIGWRIVDFPDPDVQMYANFRTGSPVALANYSNPELDQLLERARVTPDEAKRTEDYCAISRIINQEAIWFWTFQNTYYAIAKAKVKGVPKMYGGVIDVSTAWLE
jgi:4-phytase/acid phosphatase/peptide/nickel transport system substrate-binding protein